MRVSDWIVNYPRVQALLQQEGDELDYRSEASPADEVPERAEQLVRRYYARALANATDAELMALRGGPAGDANALAHVDASET